MNDPLKMDVDEEGFNAMGIKVAGSTAKPSATTAGKDNRLYDASGNLVEQTTSKLFGLDNSQLSGIADMGNLAVSAFAAYDGYKTAKLNRKALQFNLDTAKAEQARRNSNVSGFNSFGSSAPAQTAMA
mgnify:CR=1 FL=1|tara:strand:+ start:106 stop:489 length:384 start_codon:yes stop_codon:yes gene_type:complete